MVDSKPRTLNNYGQTRDWLLKFFPDDKLLSDITKGDMTRWHRHIRSKLKSVANRNKHIQRAKRFFATAVDDDFLASSPAKDLKCEKGKTDKSRQFFVNATITEQMIVGLPDANWRILFVLMRYQGMRRQEAIELKWSEVDWDAKRIEFTSTKTGDRECPIFPETLPYLKAAVEQRTVRQETVVRWHSDEHSVTPLLVKQAERIVGKAWPKICVNLRSTRRTELDDFFPSHVVDRWLGAFRSRRHEALQAGDRPAFYKRYCFGQHWGQHHYGSGGHHWGSIRR